MKGSNFLSITWEDIIYLLEKLLEKEKKIEKDYLLKKFKEELMSSRDIKTYEKEVFCTACKDSYKKVKELHIYCCQATSSEKEPIYMLPVGSTNEDKEYLINEYDDISEGSWKERFQGKGYSERLYKVIDSFIVDTNNLDSVEDEEIREKIIKWDTDINGLLKVFVLDDPVKFDFPVLRVKGNIQKSMYCNFAKLFNEGLILKDS